MVFSDQLTSTTLDAFVKQTDDLGGPDSQDAQSFWQGLCYTPAVLVDESLDPFSLDYVRQQTSLYSEISGRPLNQSVSELTTFDFVKSLNSPNPYGSTNASFISKHARAVCEAIESAQLDSDSQPHVLDMGAGWGLSSELMAFCGCKVTAVDINPQFVSLVNQRAAARSLPITCSLSSFDQFVTDESYDAIFFYECLHHSVCPWLLLEALKKMLKTSGKIVLSGEPINALWWKNWGIRLDPLSLYCIRKYGWFESGFSMDFLYLMFERIGFSVEIREGRSVNGSDIVIACPSAAVKNFNVSQHLADGLIQIDVPSPIMSAQCNERYLQSVVVRNKSSFRLASDSPPPIHLSYHWRSDNGKCVDYDGLRTLLSPPGLMPGGSQERNVKIKTPSTPGTYSLEITLVQEGVAWFDDCGGFRCAAHKVVIN
jgi:2-polyprenyl-3-methyl-5-hydroxy-6-metoxy-1,4-benzoquinol methylase